MVPISFPQLIWSTSHRFRQTPLGGVLPLCDDRRRPVSLWSLSSWVVRHEVRQSYISRTVLPRFAIHKNLHTGRIYNHTEHDVATYFRSEATANKTVENPTSYGYLLRVGSYREKTSKMTPQTALGGISRERFKQGSPNFTGLSGISGPHRLAGYDITS